jgi:tetratricopeptide (TPR) repeat protein
MSMPGILRRFPVQVILAALLVYVLTLSHGVTLASLPLTAKVAGWDWQPMTGQPLFWLLTLPLRLLPAGWVAPGLNLFSALCGALTLGIMARSLELADWDRPLAALGGWRSRLPIIFACVVCGLEFNFWQEATAATGEMLQNLLLAAAILCLLKFRGARNIRWLLAAAFIWGMGMVENWMMLLTLPPFLAALLWLGKSELLKRNLIIRLGLTGLAGFLAVFIILPLWNGLSPHSSWSFGESWLNTLKGYKNLLANLRGYFWQGYRMTSLAAIIFYLVPVLPAVVRLRDSGTLDKFLTVDQFQVWIYRGLRLAVLLACLWLAFDPIVGPRQIVLKQTGLALPFLSLDYLLGLGTGFLAGNFLLAGLAKPKNAYRSPNFLETCFERALVPTSVLLLALVSLGLLVRNAPPITLANRQPLSQFGEVALHNLPPGGGIILSDDPQRLFVFQAAAAAHGESRHWLALDLRLLPAPVYRRQLAGQHPGDWLTNLNQGALSPAGMVTLVHGLAESNSVCCLHPDFNYLSEDFYDQPAGLTFGLKPYDAKDMNPPPLTAETVAQNEKFWDVMTPQLDAIKQACAPEKTGFNRALEKIYARFHFQPVPSPQSRRLGKWYAVALDDWGVRLQRAGLLPAAQKRFEQALALDEINAAADLNLQCDTNLAAGVKQDLSAVATLGARRGSFSKMASFINAYGPVDEPSFCYLLGNACYQAGLPRESIQQFERARVLAPDIEAPQIALIRLYTRYGYEGQAQELINHLRSKMPLLSGTNSLDAELSLLEANTWLAKTNPANASSILQTMLKAHSDDAHVEDVVLHAYISFGDYTNALQLVSRQLAGDPDNLSGLFNQAGLYMKLGQFSNALPVFDHALTLSNLPPIRLARAVARIEAGQFDAAEADYLELEKDATNNLPVDSGLAEIASRRNDTNRAIDYLERCLAEIPVGNPQRDLVAARLAALKLPGKKQ